MTFHDLTEALSPTGTNSDPHSFTLNSRIMLTAIIVILFFVILMISLQLFSRWYLLRSRRRDLYRNHHAAASFIFFADPSSSTRGLDSSVIKSLPVFTFSAAALTASASECAVCLSEFQESELGRVLPNCKHTFHVDCIDMWFCSHSSCPLCRALVEPIVGEVKSVVDEVVVSISGDDVGGAGTSEDSDGRKAAAILGESGLNGSQSLRSSMSRVMSFTRMLSREPRSELGEEETR